MDFSQIEQGYPAFLPQAFIFYTTEEVKPPQYVDKTAAIAQLIEQHGFFCLCRPRRFGKTSTLHTIADIFANGTANWQDCAIVKNNLFQENQTYPVLFISFNNINLQSGATLETSLNLCFQDFAQKNNLDLDLKNLSLYDSITQIFHCQKLNKIVILIDEYDLPLIRTLKDNTDFEEIYFVLSSFYNCLKSFETKIRFMLMTGINRISSLSIFSGFNNIQDISFDSRFSSIVGYTEQELLTNFSEPLSKIANYYDLSMEDFMSQLRENYNGYCFDQKLTTKVYNTWDINKFLTTELDQTEKFPSFWLDSASISNFMLHYFEHNQPDISNILKIGAFDPPSLTLKEIKKTISFLKTPLPIFLLNAGYLTLREKQNNKYLLDFPNEQIRKYALNDLLLGVKSFLPKINNYQHLLNQNITRIFDLTITNDERKQILSEIFMSIGAVANDCFSKESQLRSLLTLLFSANNLQVQFEVPIVGGRIDLLVQHNDIHFIIELKVFSSAKLGITNNSDAIAKTSFTKMREGFKQIKKQNYANVVPSNVQKQFMVIVGDCSQGTITDIEIKNQTALAQFV